MACKHTGLMVYESARVFVETIDGYPRRNGVTEMPGQHRCCKCGEVVGFGESWDTPPEVRIEIRAAEIAATGDTSAHCERCGWDMHRHGFYCSPSDAHRLPDFHAGWLARQIATHEETP